MKPGLGSRLLWGPIGTFKEAHALKLWQKHKYGLASSRLEEAMDYKLRAYGPQSPQMFGVLSKAALFHHQTGNLCRSTELLSKLLKCMESASRDTRYGLNHPAIATVTHDLGRIYEDQNNIESAKEAYERSLGVLEALGAVNITRVSGSKERVESERTNSNDNGTGSDKNDRGNGDKIQKKEEVISTKDAAAIVADIALFYERMGNHVDAEVLHRIAFNGNPHLQKWDHPHFATSLNNFQRGEYGGVIRNVLEELNFKHTLDVQTKTLGKEHPALTPSLYYMSFIYRQNSMYKEAELLLKRVLSIERRLRGPKSTGVGTVMANMALLCIHKKDYEEAKRLLERSISIKERTLPGDHLHVGILRYELSCVAQVLCDSEIALTSIRACVEALSTEATSEDHPWFQSALKMQQVVTKEIEYAVKEREESEAIKKK